MSSSEGSVTPLSEPSPRRGSVVSVLALVLSLVAVGLAAWAVFKPAPKSPETAFSASQRADAKTAVCAAADLVRRGISLNTNLANPAANGDVTGSLAVAANARLSLSDGGQYLIARLEPATPVAVSDAVTKLADTLLDIGAAATAGALNTDPEQAARLRDADAANAAVVEACR